MSGSQNNQKHGIKNILNISSFQTQHQPFQSFQQLVKIQNRKINAFQLNKHSHQAQQIFQNQEDIYDKIRNNKQKTDNIQYFKALQASLSNNLVKLLLIILFLVLVGVLFCYQYYVWGELQNIHYEIKNYPHNLKSSLWLKAYANNKTKTINENIKNEQKFHNISYFAQKITKIKTQAKPYIDIEEVKQFKELPFCLFVTESDPNKYALIANSIAETNYKNLVILTHVLDNNNQLNAKLIKNNSMSHQKILQSMMKKCVHNSLVMLVNKPVHQKIFMKLNKIHQTINTYLVYQQKDSVIEIHSFYLRIFQLLSTNDFSKTNENYLASHNIQVLALSLLQITAFRSFQIKNDDILYRNVSRSYLFINLKNQALYKRESFDPITRLSDDFKKDIFQQIINFKKFISKAETQYESNIVNKQLSVQKMMKAAQYQDLIYLPKNHSLSQRSYQQFNDIYETGNYINNELPFCVCILSHNNVQNFRYKKVILSILQQQYSNYHIVFFDDVSKDETFSETIKQLKQLGFPQSRMTYIKNVQRKYATYNIINAAFNFCEEQDIQILIDGDDQLIGTQVFRLINGLYRKFTDKWVIYTNYKSNLMQFGESRPVPKKQQIIDNQNKRMQGHYLGQLRTWKNKLVRSIPMQYHQTKSNNWLDTVYDDAIQHCLFELASVSRVMYVPEICYQYNREYGDNDDSSEQKISKRYSTYSHLLSLKPLERINSQQQLRPDSIMVNIFTQQIKSRTFIVHKQEDNAQNNKTGIK